MMAYFQLADRVFVDAVIDRLDGEHAPMLYLHVNEDAGVDAVVMTWEHYDQLLALVADCEEATRLVMQHSHVTGDGDEPIERAPSAPPTRDDLLGDG